MSFNKIKTSGVNNNVQLKDQVTRKSGWVTENTAILVFHGIGSQLPLETLDMFGRGLVKEYKQILGNRMQLTHEVLIKKANSGQPWFDNVLRISNSASPFYIDIYEYYWANYTEDKTSWEDLNKWVQGIVKGAKNFYLANKELGKQYKDKSIFFNSKTGRFIGWRYRFILDIVSRVFFFYDQLVQLTITLLGYIPFVGKIAVMIFKKHSDSAANTISNLLGDIAAYNVTDPKSQLYAVHRQIQDGAVSALRYLVEKVNLKKNKNECDLTEITPGKKLHDAERTYPSVIIAAHSLGSQIAYDAINKLNFEINKGIVGGYRDNGHCKISRGKTIADQLKGLVTFGSPLDKIIFFLRENIPDKAYLRQQFLNDFHGFKQREINIPESNNTNNNHIKISCGLKRLLEGMLWRNYYDDKDYVSGGLDYYSNLTNINCNFKAGKFGFTHSYYWTCNKFYADIISNFLT